jgi:hypothetical protein
MHDDVICLLFVVDLRMPAAAASKQHVAGDFDIYLLA